MQSALAAEAGRATMARSLATPPFPENIYIFLPYLVIKMSLLCVDASSIKRAVERVHGARSLLCTCTRLGSGQRQDKDWGVWQVEGNGGHIGRASAGKGLGQYTAGQVCGSGGHGGRHKSFGVMHTQ